MRLKDNICKIKALPTGCVFLTDISRLNKFYRQWYASSKADVKDFIEFMRMEGKLKPLLNSFMADDCILIHEFNLWLHDYVYGGI